MNDTETKINKMLELLEDNYKTEYESLKSDYDSELKEKKAEIKKEIEKYDNRRTNETKQKVQKILKLAKAKSELNLKQKKLQLMDKLLNNILNNIKDKLANLEPEKKKYFYQKLYREATKLTNEEFTVLCNSNDEEIIKSIVSDHEIKTDDQIKGGIVLKSKNVNIKNTIDSYIMENKNKIFSLVLEEIGDVE